LFSAAINEDCFNDCEWVINSGTSRHMSHDKTIFRNYSDFEIPETVGLGDGRSMQAYGSGKIRIRLKTDGGKKCMDTTMCDVLYVPKLSCNLFSVRAAF